MQHLDGNKTPEWVHILLKGERASEIAAQEPDSYVDEFKANSLTAVHVPILEFKFKNLERLADLVEECVRASTEKNEDVGLIVTSPRVVEAILRAREPASQMFDRTLSKLSPDLIFVVGHRTGLELGKKLSLEWNTRSASSGNSAELSAFIRQHCLNQRKPARLIYPKSSLADTTIEQTLSADTNINIEPIIVYETFSLQDIRTPLMDELKRILISTAAEAATTTTTTTDTRAYRELNLNFIFFSPSGVAGFFDKINLDDLITDLSDAFSVQAEAQFSCIGKTTEAALKRLNCDVFCAPDKPSAQSLVDNISTKCRAAPKMQKQKEQTRK